MMKTPQTPPPNTARRLLPSTLGTLHTLAQALALLVGMVAPAARAEVTVTNLTVAQTPGTKHVVITYDVASTDTPTVTVSLVVKNGGMTIPVTSLTGHVGAGVATGTGKSIVWNAGADWNGNVATLAYTLATDDGQGGGGPIPAGMVPVSGGTTAGITVSSFCIGRYEVTWGEWQTVCTYAAANGFDIGSIGGGSGNDYPVDSVNWYDVVKWCNAKSEQEGRTPVYTVAGAIYRSGQNSDVTVNSVANGYRLPTDAEWEFAARGGTQSQGYTYSGSNDVNAVAWYGDNAGGSTHVVGTKAANELGLHDMSGNVWEWCLEWPGASFRISRGGCWQREADSCRVSSVSVGDPDNSSDCGFRLACPGSDSTTAATDTRDYTLTVASTQGGNPVPAIGTHSNYCWRSTVTASVDPGAVGWICTGWIGTDSIPATGMDNTTGPIILTTVASSIAWQWLDARGTSEEVIVGQGFTITKSYPEPFTEVEVYRSRLENVRCFSVDYAGSSSASVHYGIEPGHLRVRFEPDSGGPVWENVVVLPYGPLNDYNAPTVSGSFSLFSTSSCSGSLVILLKRSCYKVDVPICKVVAYREALALSISRGTTDGLIDLTVRNTAIGTVYDLQTSTNLVDWETLRQVTGQLEPQVIRVERDGPCRFYRLSTSTIVEPWSFFINGNVLYDARDGQQRLFRGLAFSGLEYGKVTHNYTPAEYPGDEGQQYFAPTQATFDLVRDLGANCVRLPFDWGRLVRGVADYQPGTPVTFDSEYLGYLQDAVRWAGERDIFVILDMHNSLEYAASRIHLIGVNENTNYRAFLAETWRALARQFGAYPNVLGYEIVNEPNPQSGESNWPAIAQEIINALREVDSRRLVFIDGSDYSGAQQWVLKSDALRNLTDSADRLVYAPHLYVDRSQNGTYDPGDEQPVVNWQYDLYEDVKGILAWSQEVQRPVLITEFGFLSLHDAWDPVLQELLTEYLDFHGIGAILWNLETNSEGNKQETYVYGGTGYVIGTYSNHIHASYEGVREGYILADNLHNGFDLDIWNDSLDPRQDWARYLKEGMGVGGGVALSLSGSNWGGGVNILYRDAHDQPSTFDVSGYESLSFMHRGTGVLVWVQDAQDTEVFPKYTVPSHDAYTRVTIPLSGILGAEPRLKYIKIQIEASGSVLLDEIVLE